MIALSRLAGRFSDACVHSRPRIPTGLDEQAGRSTNLDTSMVRTRLFTRLKAEQCRVSPPDILSEVLVRPLQLGRCNLTYLKLDERHRGHLEYFVQLLQGLPFRFGHEQEHKHEGDDIQRSI